MRLKSSLPDTRSAFQLRASATSTIERATDGLLVSVARRKVDSVKGHARGVAAEAVLGAADGHVAHRHRGALDDVAVSQRGFEAGNQGVAFGLGVDLRDGFPVGLIGLKRCLGGAGHRDDVRRAGHLVTRRHRVQGALGCRRPLLASLPLAVDLLDRGALAVLGYRDETRAAQLLGFAQHLRQGVGPVRDLGERIAHLVALASGLVRRLKTRDGHGRAVRGLDGATLGGCCSADGGVVCIHGNLAMVGWVANQGWATAAVVSATGSARYSSISTRRFRPRPPALTLSATWSPAGW